MDASSTISVRLLRGMDTYMLGRGLAFASMARDAGIDLSVAADPDGMISLQGLYDLHEAAARATGDEAFGLGFGLAHATDSAGLFHYLTVSSPTIEDALSASVRFLPLVTTGYHLSFDNDGDGAYLSWHFQAPPLARAQYGDFAVGLVVARVRQQLDTDWRPVCVDFERAPPRDSDPFTAQLCKDVRFGQTATRIGFDKPTLARPMASFDPRLFELLDKVGRQKLGLPQERIGVAQQATEFIRKSLPSGKESVETTATHLGITVRTLQRELAEAGTTYSDLVEDVRRGMARQLIIETELPLTEIAFVVGFSELSAFSRAARKWFREPPSAMRKRHKEGTGG